jgi:predicted nucleic acid-binding Zn ribbon protein
MRRSAGEDPGHPGRSIGESLSAWLTQRGLAQRRLAERGLDRPDGLAAVAACWPAVAGEELARHCRPVALDGEVLLVAVDHPTLVTELSFASAGLLERLATCTGAPVARRLKVIVRGSLGLE